jgi:CHAT domain-containing protein
LEEATRYAEESVILARQVRDTNVLATALNHQGNVLMAQQRYSDALQIYHEGIALAEPDPALTVTLTINAIHVHLVNETAQEAIPLLRAALNKTRDLADSYAKTYDLISLGYLAQRLESSLPAQSTLLTQWAYTAFSDALKLAESLGDVRAKSYAAGHLGELYIAAKRYHDAEPLLRQALFLAEQSEAPELLARWHWQFGRLLKAQGKTDGTKAAYLKALDQFQSIQSALVFGQRGYPQFFRETVGAVYLELAELLLQEASTSTNAEQRRQTLRQVRDVMEGFKVAELKNYFQDECVAVQQETRRPASLDKLLKPKTAVLYPILFPDRIALLLTLANGGIKQVDVPLSAVELRQTATAFREQLAKGGNPRRLLTHAQALYDWLIRPIASELRSDTIDTLVVVPDGILRTIPFAALHDGKDFLVSRYALVITPGLTLTDPGVFAKGDYRVLLNGLSEGVQNFGSLPHVSDEISKIAPLYDSTQLLNGAFRKTNVRTQLERTPYSIILFATHGRFLSDPRQSFLLTYDDKITFDELERFIRIGRFREQPVELLVLSACETAEGDERAALGLAGVAVKAGASGAVASLWAVNDISSAELIPVFFENLKNPTLSKAQALQKAQLKLLADDRYRHPFYWAPFVLIGNWH